MVQLTRLGFENGNNIFNWVGNKVICRINRALKELYNESHLLKGFLRFSVYKNVLTAVIGPKNNVLPILKKHFADRYPAENFFVFDKTHRLALIHMQGRCTIIPVEEFQTGMPDESEAFVQMLWKEFYRSVEIKNRHNPACRRSHMPKRYWPFMTELQTEMLDKEEY